ncbi:sulfite exporter TauE/SafE family protein [Arthrobacter castelli]|uniref:sulfite exporter TauE/SafE family protein n=1 Tax=Arthrobacter castelli TaxID=271431 RepID=UPI000401E66C|nr:sulfite exporter TauE/SafE family protein [Arthrobacter castelli]
MTPLLLVLTLAAVVISAIAQRVAGLGFAMLLAPFLVLIFGPYSGILLVNLLGATSAGIMFIRVRSFVDWGMYWRLAVPAVVMSVPFSILALALPAAPLEAGVGFLLVLALAVSVVLHRGPRTIDGPGVRTATGLSSGITNALAGVGGPTVSVYAVISRWDQRKFAATVQPYFMTIGLAAMATKSVVDPGEWPVLSGWTWAALLGMILLGMYVGERVARFIDDRTARKAVIIIAFLGAVSTMVKGLINLM